MNSKLQETLRRTNKQRSERGATAAEYGLLVGFIAFAIILGVTALGVNIDAAYNGWAAIVATF